MNSSAVLSIALFVALVGIYVSAQDAPAPASAPAVSGGGSPDSYYDSFTKKTYYKSAFPQPVCGSAKGCLWKNNEGGYDGCYCKPKERKGSN